MANWALLEMKERNLFLSPPPTLSSSQSINGFNLNERVTPTILLIIIILAIIFFISGLFHLLIRFLSRPSNINHSHESMDNLTTLQGQLQQLFHLHDGGVDQSFIDTLPLFTYKSIIGLKDPFDCAVCLCEFEPEDNLRLLPNCSHAFHMGCIDTWLLAHSTCPICRASLFLDFSQRSNFLPVVMVLESGSGREIDSDGDFGLGNANSVDRESSHLSTQCGDDFRLTQYQEPFSEILEREDERVILRGEEKVVSLKLGKYRSSTVSGEGISESNNEARRCFSMGSFAYVMDENSSLKVPIRTIPMNKKESIKKPCHRLAMSESGSCDSIREFNGFEAFRMLESQSGGNGRKSIVRSKGDSFSVSKIWLRGVKGKINAATMESSRRAFSFRFPMGQNIPVAAANEMRTKNGAGAGGDRTLSEMDIIKWENEGCGLNFDEEVQRCNSSDYQANAPSFGRRTLGWLMGRQNRVVRTSFSSNV